MKEDSKRYSSVSSFDAREAQGRIKAPTKAPQSTKWTRGRIKLAVLCGFLALLILGLNFERITGLDFRRSYYPAIEDLLPIPGLKMWIYGDPDPREVTINYRDLKPAPKDSREIPKILFRTSAAKAEQLSVELRKILKDNKELNVGYQQVYFDDEDINTFVSQEYPQYDRSYHALVPGAYKADLFRLLVLYKYGGIYNDIGHRYFLPVGQVIGKGDEFVAATEISKQHSFAHALYNGILAAYPRHPIIKFMIDDVLYTIDHCMYMADPLDITGPAAIGRALNKFMLGWPPGYTGTGPLYDRIPIKRGAYVQQGYKIKLLQHNPRREIISMGEIDLLRTKFPSYYKRVYQDEGTRYDSLWKSREVFRSDATCLEHVPVPENETLSSRRNLRQVARK